MNRGRDRRQVRLDSQKHYKGLEDYLKKMGVDVTKGVDAGGQEHSD